MKMSAVQFVGHITIDKKKEVIYNYFKVQRTYVR